MDRRLTWFLVLFAPVLAWSWLHPHDRFTWWLESVPIVAAIPLMLATQKRFPLSSMLLVLIWLHGTVIVVGGHYTYAEVPLGEWAKGWFGWTRNNYDKLGHFAEGFVPAILTRELLLRNSPLRGIESGRPSRWLGFLVVCVCLAFSAFYELIEWCVAVTTGEAADAFLGTQGDPWDTQTDMLMALVGALVAVVGFSHLHDRSLARLLARLRGGIPGRAVTSVRGMANPYRKERS
jgi:putative membrane protein